MWPRARRSLVALVLACLVPAAPAARAFDPDEDRTARVFVEVGTGSLGTALGGLLGSLAGLGICGLAGESDREWGCFGAVLIGAATGGWWGMAAGVTLGGEAMGANGGVGWELLGQVGGTALASGLTAVIGDDLDVEAWLVVHIALPLAGGILAYELSTTVEREDPEARSRALIVPLGFRF